MGHHYLKQFSHIFNLKIYMSDVMIYCLKMQWRRKNQEKLTLYLLVSSADNLCKQFGPRSGGTKCWAWSGSNLLDTEMVFLKEFFEKFEFEKNQLTAEKHEKFPSGQLNWIDTWDLGNYHKTDSNIINSSHGSFILKFF